MIGLDILLALQVKVAGQPFDEDDVRKLEAGEAEDDELVVSDWKRARKAALVLTTIAIAVFWCTVLRVVVAIIAAGVVVVVGFGAFVILQAMHN
jgi:hypothetical protein